MVIKIQIVVVGNTMKRYTNLRTKSIHNYETAKSATENKYYDVAVSRYYYALFQLIHYVMYNRKPNFSVPQKNTHRFTIKEFTAFIARKQKKYQLKDEDIPNLMVLDNMKRLRQQADYNKDRLITKNEYDDFIKKFDGCYGTIVDKILEEV